MRLLREARPATVRQRGRGNIEKGRTDDESETSVTEDEGSEGTVARLPQGKPCRWKPDERQSPENGDTDAEDKAPERVRNAVRGQAGTTGGTVAPRRKPSNADSA